MDTNDKKKMLEKERLREDIKKKEDEILRHLIQLESLSQDSSIELQKNDEKINKINREINILSNNLSISEKND